MTIYEVDLTDEQARVLSGSLAYGAGATWKTPLNQAFQSLADAVRATSPDPAQHEQ